MADLNKHHEAMLRRHRPAIVMFAKVSKVAPEKLAFVIADATSKLGQAMKQSGVITSERASVVLPTTVDAIPAFLEVSGMPEIEQLVTEHGAVPVLLIDNGDHAVVRFEAVSPSPRTQRIRVAGRSFDDSTRKE